VGRHSLGGGGGSAQALIASINQQISDLQAQMGMLNIFKDNSKKIGAVVMGWQTQNHDVMITGGALLNNIPQDVDQLTNAIQMHIATLEYYRETL